VKLPKLTSVDTIKDAMSDPLIKAKLACYVSTAQLWMSAPDRVSGEWSP